MSEWKIVDTGPVQPPPPRCPSCGEPLHEWRDIYACVNLDCPVHKKKLDDADRPPVPCPSCAGRGYVAWYMVNILDSVQQKRTLGQWIEEVESIDYDLDCEIECAVCRGSGVVPPALAAAWVAAGQRSGGGEVA